jgi:hypothetical protein
MCSCFLCNAQERYFNLYPGWSVRFAYENNNSFYFSGLDTIFEYNSNTPIHNITSKNGELIESHRYVSDTIYGFSFYSNQSYSYEDSLIMASGVLADLTKYILNPVLCYFSTTDYNLDSVISFRTYFDDRSSIIMFHRSFEDSTHIFGRHLTNPNWDTKTFFAVYKNGSGEFWYKDYVKPNNCQMTPYQALPTADGGYLIATEQDMTYLYPERVKACILKIDAAGNEEWRFVIPGETNVPPWNLEACTYRPRIFNAPDGNYWVVW